MLAYLFGSDSRAPVLLKLRSSETFIIFTVSSAIFTDIFVYGIVVPVLPFALTSRASIDPGEIQKWISIFLAVYGAALLVAAPFCGWFADRLGSRRWPLLWGLLALGGSTVMLCIGNSIAVLAAGRVLQGISAAVVWVVGLALLVDTVGPENIGTAMGYVSLSMSLSILVGPLLGGIVFAHSGYYAVWAMAFGLIILDVILRFAMIEKQVARKWMPDGEADKTAAKPHSQLVVSEEAKITQLGAEPAHEDGDEAIELSEPASPWIEGKPNPGRKPSAAPSTASEIAVASMPASVPTFVKSVVQHLPPIVFLLGSRRVLSAIFACTIQAALLTSFDALLPLFVHNTFQWDSIGAGLMFIPLVVPSFASPFVGHLSDKYGPRWFATAGFVVCAPFYILLRLVDTNTLHQKVLLCALLTLIGIGLMLALTPLMAEIAYAVEAKAQRRPAGFFGKNGAYAQAFSLFNMAWAAGCFLGPLLAGLVNVSRGWGTTTAMLGGISLFTALPAAVWTGGSIFKRRQRAKDQTATEEASG